MNNNQIVFKTETRALHELLPASYNPRKMTAKQNEDLIASLNKFGLAEIPVINTDNTILAGHQRIRVLSDLYGKEHVIDVRVPNRTLTEDEEKEYNIRSNKNTGEWDWDKLANEFEVQDLKNWGFENWEIGETKESKSSKNKEIDINDLSKDDFVIKISFTNNDKYLEAMESLQNAQSKLGVNNTGDVLIELLKKY